MFYIWIPIQCYFASVSVNMFVFITDRDISGIKVFNRPLDEFYCF